MRLCWDSRFLSISLQSNATWHDFDAIEGALDKGARLDFGAAIHDEDGMDLDTKQTTVEGGKSKKDKIPRPLPPGFTSLDSILNSAEATIFLAKIFILLADDTNDPGALRTLISVPGILETTLGKKALDCITAMGREIATRCVLVLADGESEGDNEENEGDEQEEESSE